MIVERKPGTAVVEVVDAEGRGVPFARLSLFDPDGEEAWMGSWDVADGVQDVGAFTDREGRRVLRHLPPGVLGFRATLGNRKAETTAIVAAASETQVRIVLRD